MNVRGTDITLKLTDMELAPAGVLLQILDYGPGAIKFEKNTESTSISEIGKK